MKDRIIYRCPDGLVTVVRKTKGLKRFPPSDYPCGLLILRARKGTRVVRLNDHEVEFMPAFDDLRAALEAIDPRLAKLLPPELKNKPRSRRNWWAIRNRQRRRRGK